MTENEKVKSEIPIQSPGQLRYGKGLQKIQLAKIHHIAFVVTLFFGFATSAQPTSIEYDSTAGVLRLNLATNPIVYYLIEGSTNLVSLRPLVISSGVGALRYEFPATNSVGFYRVSAISVYAPQDTLGDGIDDVFKLNFGLAPLDPDLAARDSGFKDSQGHSLSWLQYYEVQFSRNLIGGEVYGREISIFNFGLPTSRLEGFSREVSIFNGESPALVRAPQEVYGREVSVFNFGEPTAPREALSMEVSVFNGQSPPLVIVPQEVYGREVSVFNTGESPGQSVYVTREVSVFNFGQPTAAFEAISMEVSVFNNTL